MDFALIRISEINKSYELFRFWGPKLVFGGLVILIIVAIINICSIRK